MPWEEKPFSSGFFVFSVSLSLIKCQRYVFNAAWTQFFHTYLCEKFQLLHRFDNSCLVRYRYLIKFFSLVTLERNNSCQFCCSFVFFSQFHHLTLFHFLNDNTIRINQISLVLVILESETKLQWGGDCSCSQRSGHFSSILHEWYNQVENRSSTLYWSCAAQAFSRLNFVLNYSSNGLIRICHCLQSAAQPKLADVTVPAYLMHTEHQAKASAGSVSSPNTVCLLSTFL